MTILIPACFCIPSKEEVNYSAAIAKKPMAKFIRQPPDSLLGKSRKFLAELKEYLNKMIAGYTLFPAIPLPFIF
jgi:hypothetical protein